MSFQLLPLTGAPLVSDIAAGMFADITMSAFNRLSQDGEGRLVIEVAGADPIRVPEAMIVFGAFAGDFSFELGEGQQDVQHQAAHRGRRVELLGDRHERHTKAFEHFDHLGEVCEAACQAIL